jgi:hypothetical protein
LSDSRTDVFLIGFTKVSEECPEGPLAKRVAQMCCPSSSDCKRIFGTNTLGLLPKATLRSGNQCGNRRLRREQKRKNEINAQAYIEFFAGNRYNVKEVLDVAVKVALHRPPPIASECCELL